MKKILLLAFLLICYGLQAQVSWVVADCDTSNWDNTTPFLPVWGSEMNSAHHNQLLYLGADLEPVVDHEITKITFHSASNNVVWKGATATVKIMYTAVSALGVGFQDVTAATQVFTGSFAIENQFLAFTFSTPFLYTGGNLLIDIETTPASNYQKTMFYGFPSTIRLGNHDGFGIYFYTKAIFEYTVDVPTYTLTASASEGGTISPGGTTVVMEHQEKRFDFAANPYYKLSKVLIDNVANPQAVTDGFYIFTDITDNHTIRAEFAKTGGTYVVANGSEINGSVPFLSSYMNCGQHIQMLYLSEFMEGLLYKNITKMTYHAGKANETFSGATGDVNIMLTSATNLTDDFLNGPAIQVYSGTLEIKNYLLEINFATPFTYTGGNLLIDFTVFPTGQPKYVTFYGISSEELSRICFTFEGTTFNRTHPFTPKTTFEYSIPNFKTYMVTFMANGGAGIMVPQEFTEYQPQALTANGFTRPNHEFTGWNTHETGDGECYDDQQIITINEDKTLFAHWKSLGGIDELNHRSFLRIAPNPAREYVELRITNYELGINDKQLIMNDVEIFDIYGRKQHAESSMRNAEGAIILDVSHLSAGIYFIRVVNETVKLVVQ